MIFWLAFLLSLGHIVIIFSATWESCPMSSSSAIPTWSALVEASTRLPQHLCSLVSQLLSLCFVNLSLCVCLPPDYELIEFGGWFIHLYNYNSQQKHNYQLECPSFPFLHAFAYAIPGNIFCLLHCLLLISDKSTVHLRCHSKKFFPIRLLPLKF